MNINKQFSVTKALSQDTIGYWVREVWPSVNFIWLYGIDMVGPPSWWERLIDNMENSTAVWKRNAAGMHVPGQIPLPRPFSTEREAIAAMEQLEKRISLMSASL